MTNRNHAAEHMLLIESRELRVQACDLLNRLLDHREQSEARFAEIGSTDPIKSVTGRSAIDNAIDATRTLLRQLDSIADSPSPSAPLEVTTVHRHQQHSTVS